MEKMSLTIWGSGISQFQNEADGKTKMDTIADVYLGQKTTYSG